MRTLGIGLRRERLTQTGEESSLSKFTEKISRNIVLFPGDYYSYNVMSAL